MPLRVAIAGSSSTADVERLARLARELTLAGAEAHVENGPRALAARMDGGDVDIAHVHGWPGVRAVAPIYGASARHGIPLVLTLHAVPARIAALLATSEAVLGWSRCMVLSGVSSVVAAQAARWIRDANVGVLPFGVDLDLWRAHPGLREDGIVRLASAPGLTRDEEGVALLRAFAFTVRFVAGTPSLQLSIAGEGPARPRLMKLASELGVGARVEWLGHLTQAQLHASYARANAFVAASADASAATAALEARAAGLPVVARLSSGARDFISPGIHGFLARNEAELGQFMARLALEEPLRRFIANRNRREPPPFDWRTVVRMHEDLYEAAVARVDAARPPNQR